MYICKYRNRNVCTNKCIHIDALILTLYSTMYVLCRAFNDCCKLTSNESLKSLCRTFFLDTRNDCHSNKYPGKGVEYVANSSSETRWKCLQWQQQAKTSFSAPFFNTSSEKRPFHMIKKKYIYN